MASPKGLVRALLEQKQQLEPLLHISPSAIVITDRDANVVAWNPAAEQLFGYTAEEATGRNLDDLVATTDELHRAAVSYSEQALEKDQIRTVTRRTRKDGTLVDVEVRAAPLVANGETIGMFGIYHDVTELHRQKRFYEALLEVSPAAIVAIDPADNVTLWNRAAERLFGYTADEAVGENVDALVAANEELRAEAERLNRTAEGGQIRMVARRTRKDGSLVDVELLGAPVMVGDELVGRYAIYLDISELQRRKQYYEALVELSPEAIVTTDGDDTVTSWNPAAERLFGYSAEEAIGTNIDDLVARGEEQMSEGRALSRSALEGPTPHRVTQRTRKDGSLADVDIVGGPVIVGGELVGKHVFYHDVTELQRQKRYYESLVQLSPTAITTVDTNDTVTSWNPAAERLFGYTAEEAIGRHIDDLVANREDIHDEGLRVSEDIGERQIRLITRRTRKDGSMVDVDVAAAPILVGGELVGKYALYHDITELQEQKRYFQSLLEISPTAIVVMDLDANVTSWNPAAEQLFGYPADEAIGRHLDDLVATRPDLREEALGYSRLAAEGKHVEGIARRTRKDGALVDVHMISEPVVVGDERVGFLVIYHDITEIQQQKRYYEALLEVSPTAIITVDRDGKVTSWNPAAEQMFGYTADEAMGHDIDELVAGSDEMREEAIRLSQEGRTTKTRTGAITRRTRKDGTLVDVQVAGVPVFIGGEHVGDLVVYHDLTEIQRQKRYYEALFRGSPVAIALLDFEGNVTSWNPTAEELFGYSAEEAIGRNIDDLVANSDEIRAEAVALTRMGMGGAVNRVITRRTRKDGTFVDVEMHGAQVVVGGELVGLYAMYHDISEIQRQKRYYEALVEVSPVAVVLMDNEGTITSWSPAAERLFGYSAEEAIGRSISDVVAADPLLRKEAEGYLRDMQQGAEFFHAITRRTRRDGMLVDVEIHTAPVVIGDQRVGFYVLYHDIGELQQARREAEAATRAKSAFLATMSHEIRTPLNAVIGMTGLLLDTDLAPEQRGYGEVIRTSGDALLTVINEILDFSKIEAGRLDLESRPFGLRSCVESTLELVATAAADKSLDLAYMIDPRTPASIVGDFTRLRQILLNLLNNAVKFTHQGEVVLRVDATPIGAAGAARGPARYEIHFSVKDTGIGIPEDRMDRLFEAFTQVDASTTRRYGGTGLGLAISKRLAEEMGGRLWAESRVGEGSTFHATIAAEAASGPMATEELGAIPEVGGKRVLIVDDNATNREILRRQAESWQMVPVEAESPAKALEYVRRGDPFDIAILDMQMPEMDGMALAEEIRRHRDAEDLPLVMLTSLGRRDPSPAGAEFAAYLTKPIRPSQLYDVLIGIFAPRATPQRVSKREPVQRSAPAEHPHLRILLAEDNAVNQRVALLLLEKLGYRADVAADGREALQALERQPYHVVLMDVQMPEMDGLEATRHILERWPEPDRPRIIAMTAGATEADRAACLAAGMDDYVSKPIRREELAAALSRAVPGDDGPDLAPSGSNIRGDGAATIDRDGLHQLRQTVGGEEALQDVMNTFLEDTERILVALRTDVAEGRAAEVRRQAHSLKSTAASFGASRLSELCRELEGFGRSGDLRGAAALIDDIATEFARVREALRPGGGP